MWDVEDYTIKKIYINYSPWSSKLTDITENQLVKRELSLLGTEKSNKN